MIFANVLSQLPIALPAISYRAVAPELVLFGGALLILLVSATTGRKEHPGLYRAIALAAAVVEGGFSGYQLYLAQGAKASLAVAGSIAYDGFSAFAGIVVAAVLILGILIGPGFVQRIAGDGPEYLVLVLVSAMGALVMAQGEDLIVIFIGLEILSIALYGLVGYRIGDGLAREAAFKYFILGGFSSAIFLYGTALVYGATGSTNLAKIANFLSVNVLVHNGVLLFGLALLLLGFGFKVSAVPFHLWSPDVYQGAPTSVTGYMAAMAKVGAFAALIRVFDVAFGSQITLWRPIVVGLAILSMLFGALFALRQRELKKILAYSSINHAGFILLGVYAGTAAAISNTLFYLVAYAVIVVGTFGLVSIIQDSLGVVEGSCSLDQLRGLARSRPALATVTAIMVLAQAGAPFTTGFLAKFSIIVSVVEIREYWIAVVAMISAAIAVAFYLRIVLAMFRGEQEQEVEGERVLAIQGAATEIPGRRPALAWIGVSLSLLFTIGFGVFPQPLLDLAARAHIIG